MVAQRQAWGEQRVFFHAPPHPDLRSIPVAWTSLAPPDPFLVLAQGRALLRFIDAQRLYETLRAAAAGHSRQQQEED